MEKNSADNKAQQSWVGLGAKTSNLSYELRTKLTTLLGFLDILNDQDLKSLNTEQLEAIRKVDQNSVEVKDSILELISVSQKENEVVNDLVKVKTTVDSHSWLIRGLFTTIVVAFGWVLADRSNLIENVNELLKDHFETTSVYTKSIDERINRHLDKHERSSREEIRRLHEKLNK